MVFCSSGSAISPGCRSFPEIQGSIPGLVWLKCSSSAFEWFISRGLAPVVVVVFAECSSPLNFSIDEASFEKGYCYPYTTFCYIYTPLYFKEILVELNRPTEISSPIDAFLIKKK